METLWPGLQTPGWRGSTLWSLMRTRAFPSNVGLSGSTHGSGVAYRGAWYRHGAAYSHARRITRRSEGFAGAQHSTPTWPVPLLPMPFTTSAYWPPPPNIGWM